MDLLIEPTRLRGSVRPPASKSGLHRALLAAALADGTSTLEGTDPSDDVNATLSAVRALGASVFCGAEDIRVRGCGGKRLEAPIRVDCGRSASTLRLTIPLSLALAGGGDFSCDESLLRRPLQPYRDALQSRGVSFTEEEGVLRVRGTLPAGEYRLTGSVSSQFFSGLLLALPLTDGVSALRWTSPPESAGYIGMTVEAQRNAGVRVESDAGGFFVRPQPYHAFNDRMEADWSQAAFWLAAASLGQPLRIEGMNESSIQPDSAFPALVRLIVEGKTVDLSQTPDLAPPLALLAALIPGEHRFEGCGRLRLKESDRLETICAALSALGAMIRSENDRLYVWGCEKLAGGGTVDAAGDHRIAMMSAISAVACERPFRLLGADCVSKSYPRFWKEYERLGGKCHVVSLG